MTFSKEILDTRIEQRKTLALRNLQSSQLLFDVSLRALHVVNRRQQRREGLRDSRHSNRSTNRTRARPRASLTRSRTTRNYTQENASLPQGAPCQPAQLHHRAKARSRIGRGYSSASLRCWPGRRYGRQVPPPSYGGKPGTNSKSVDGPRESGRMKCDLCSSPSRSLASS